MPLQAEKRVIHVSKRCWKGTSSAIAFLMGVSPSCLGKNRRHAPPYGEMLEELKAER